MIKDLNKIQDDFIDFTKRREIIQIHSYKLPTSILHKEFASDESSVVLCIHNGHETVDNKMMVSFLKSIREFLKQ